MAESDLGEVSSPENATITDRRRPGRVEYENAHLVDLLRGAGSSGEPSGSADDPVVSPADSDAYDDGLAPARGVLLGSLIGSVAWIVIGLAIWLLY